MHIRLRLMETQCMYMRILLVDNMEHVPSYPGFSGSMQPTQLPACFTVFVAGLSGGFRDDAVLWLSLHREQQKLIQHVLQRWRWRAVSASEKEKVQKGSEYFSLQDGMLL